MSSNSILFATDFSDRDLEAFKSSCQLALDWNAKLHIVHVLDPREAVKPPSRQTNPDREFVRFIPEDFGIEFKQTVLTGDADEEILRFAEDKNVALIVLGTHGRKGVQRVFSGSIAEKIMRHAKCPVMTRRSTGGAFTKRKLERILVPIDFSVYGYAAVDFASRMALATSAELTICFVDETDSSSAHVSDWSEYQQGLWEKLRKYEPTSAKVGFSHKLFKGEPGKEICDYANSERFDFIVIGTHGRTGLTRALLGSVAEYVVRHADCPVISVKPTNKRAHLIS